MKNEKIKVAEKLDKMYKELLEEKDFVDIYRSYAMNKKKTMFNIITNKNANDNDKKEARLNYECSKENYLEAKDRKREIENEIAEFIESLKA